MASTSPSTAAKLSPTANTKPNRLPAPTLFVGPPSRNASQLSVARPNPAETQRAIRDPLHRQRSALSRPVDPDSSAADLSLSHSSSSQKDLSGGNPARVLRKDSQKSVNRLWQDMQNTLDEVEMAGQSSTHVFGESHARALDDLRRAQVELARAWARGSEESGVGAEHAGMDIDVHAFKGAAELASDREKVGGARRKRGGTDASASTVMSDGSVRSEDTLKSGRSQLEDETAEDIRKASERRAANEAYFRMVEGSVSEVVQKLQLVAQAMRGVEGESRSLWSGSESLGSSGVGEETERERSPKSPVTAVK